MTMDRNKIEERRRYVEELYFLRGVPFDTIAEILGCYSATVRDDAQIIRGRLLSKAEATSEAAGHAADEFRVPEEDFWGNEYYSAQIEEREVQ